MGPAAWSRVSGRVPAGGEWLEGAEKEEGFPRAGTEGEPSGAGESAGTGGRPEGGGGREG